MTRRKATKNLDEIARQLGITRLADITGLDVAGLPVVQAVRPFSLSNAVSQGKGQTLEAAARSAIFESAESFFAEKLENFDATFTTAEKLDIPADRYEKHLLGCVSSDWHKQALPWVEAKNLVSGHSAMVPLELVHTAYVLPQQIHDGIFCATTTGLAAAFKAEDAALHGILECIERDAIMRSHGTHGFLQRRRIDPRTITDPEVNNLLEMLRQKGFLVGLWHAPSPVGVPVIWCHLMEDRKVDTALMPFPAEGTAARLDVVAAISHAIYEAAQSRLTAISGARDDFTRRNYPKYPDWQMIAAHRRLIVEGPKEVQFQNLIVDIVPSTEGLLSKLEATNHHDVYEIQLEHMAPIDGIAVTKIIIPSLLPLVEG
jgi:YcaO-like protein with predicted kinase domain